MRCWFLVLSALLTLFLTLFLAPSAHACGGMLFENHESRPGGMSDQQVLIAHTPDETIVVLSVAYTGASGGFAFLMPLQKATSNVRDGDANLFAQLEDETAPRVIVEDATREPPPQSGGCACGGGAAKSGAAYATRAGGPSVVVVDRGQTQTYDYVVIGGDDAQTVSTWLEQEGFQAPAAFQTAIDAYLAKGWLFLAAKLRAAAPEGHLAPLELHFADLSLETLTYPFSMSAHSLAPKSRVSVTLYLVGQRPFLPVDYAVAPIDAKRIAAVSPADSNYEQVFEEQTRDGSMVLEYGARGVNPFEVMSGETAKRIARLLGEGADKGALVRLRAELSPEQLKDAGFRAAKGSEAQQTNVHRVVWRGGGALPAKSDATFLGWILIGAMAIARRRRLR